MKGEQPGAQRTTTRSERAVISSHESPTPREEGAGRLSSSWLVVGGIKVSGDRGPKISSAGTTLRAAWAIRSRPAWSLRKLRREIADPVKLIR